MLVEKTDRLYRNLKDWVTIDELDVEMHLPKEGVVLSRESRSSEKFMHGIKVLMAKNYIDNLSEEARKGMQEKAEQGIWPTKTPLGYRNVTGPDGKKIIATDPGVAPIMAKLFEWYATRRYFAEGSGAQGARGGPYLSARAAPGAREHSSHHPAEPALYGLVRMERQAIQGKHEALVPVDLWERVQGVLDGRFASKASAAEHDFAFSGLIACAPAAAPWSARSRSSATSIIIAPDTPINARAIRLLPPQVRARGSAGVRFTELLGRLRFDDEVLEWVRDALHASHADERHEHEEAIRRLRAEYKRLSDRIHASMSTNSRACRHRLLR